MNTRELAYRIRRHALFMTNRGRASHIGSVFSLADILGVLYGEVLRYRADEPEWPERDRLVLSKGHVSAGIYAVLAESGFFPVEYLENYYKNGSTLGGHVTSTVPGVDFSTGSLGHGLPVAAGMAYAARLDGNTHRVFTILSDGDCDEGSTWEAALFAAHHKLSRLVAILDYNKLQSLDTVENTLALEPLADKWTSFGWRVLEVDGHDHDALRHTFNSELTDAPVPTAVISHTVKGKGVSFMENSVLWHYRIPAGEEMEAAVAELETNYKK